MLATKWKYHQLYPLSNIFNTEDRNLPTSHKYAPYTPHPHVDTSNQFSMNNRNQHQTVEPKYIMIVHVVCCGKTW